MGQWSNVTSYFSMAVLRLQEDRSVIWIKS